jgi:hypothetical protein
VVQQSIPADQRNDIQAPRRYPWSGGFGQATIVNASLTKVNIGFNCVKVVPRYDNEWGYACRVRDLIELVGKGLSGGNANYG